MIKNQINLCLVKLFVVIVLINLSKATFFKNELEGLSKNKTRCELFLLKGNEVFFENIGITISIIFFFQKQCDFISDIHFAEL